MNYIDIILIVPLLWGFYRGFSRGLIIEIATIVALFLALWLGVEYHDIVLSWLKEYPIIDTVWLPVISFAIIFLGIILLVLGIARLLTWFLQITALGFFNRLAGGLLGILKYALVLSVILCFMEKMNTYIEIIPAQAKDDSLLYEWIQPLALLVIPDLHTLQVSI